MNIPRFKAVVSEDGITCSFWCPFCRLDHIHGTTGRKPPQTIGHRVSHCVTALDSPLKKTGYYVDLIEA